MPGFFCGIGEVRLKYRGWGLPYDRSRLVDHRDGFTVWYTKGDATVGVLTYQADEDYENGEKLVAAGEPPPVDMG